LGEVAVDLPVEGVLEDAADLIDEISACEKQYLWLMVKTP
jgi:hypothetical protein